MLVANSVNVFLCILCLTVILIKDLWIAMDNTISCHRMI